MHDSDGYGEDKWVKKKRGNVEFQSKRNGVLVQWVEEGLGKDFVEVEIT